MTMGLIYKKKYRDRHYMAERRLLRALAKSADAQREKVPAKNLFFEPPPEPKAEPSIVVNVIPARHKTIKMRRENGNLVADVFENEAPPPRPALRKIDINPRIVMLKS